MSSTSGPTTTLTPFTTSYLIHAIFTIGDPILHIELRCWAGIVLVAPCSANTLAKITT
ncbi:hypothetical protein JVT61DRAFT_959 [Boletus reticuloceps]|uniref:Flavoprotein domain-containing protein n=1 Tax=Boletus reticuloceps TaxID=495285 RepID=A0A8I2YUG2_9AGAM|nr:hypothetical protein JVT61DRAFT_959 [Boletus reticuloceps]